MVTTLHAGGRFARAGGSSVANTPARANAPGADRRGDHCKRWRAICPRKGIAGAYTDCAERPARGQTARKRRQTYRRRSGGTPHATVPTTQAAPFLLAAGTERHYRPSEAAARATAKPGPHAQQARGPQGQWAAGADSSEATLRRRSGENLVPPGLWVWLREWRAASKKGAAGGRAEDPPTAPVLHGGEANPRPPWTPPVLPPLFLSEQSERTTAPPRGGKREEDK